MPARPRTTASRSALLGGWVIAALLCSIVDGAAARGDAPALRVCADPNNLPFSNRAGEGFENAIAALVARELRRPLQYTFSAQRRGFVRNTLDAGLCDLIVAVPAGLERVRTTRPYYRARYAFVSRAERGLRVRSFDAPALRALRIGVQLVGDDYANTPPAHALGRRGLIDNVVGYTVYGDYAQPDPAARVLQAVQTGEVDIAVVWGPLTARHAAELAVVPIAQASDGGLPLEFAISMGVRRDDRALQRRLERVLQRKRAEILQILRRFAVPFEAVAAP